MIEIKVHDKTTEINIQGEKLVCLTEAVMLFAELIEAVSPAFDMPPDVTAVLLYQKGLDAYKRKREYLEESGNVSS